MADSSRNGAIAGVATFQLRRESDLAERMIERALATRALVTPLGSRAARVLDDCDGLAAFLRWWVPLAARSRYRSRPWRNGASHPWYGSNLAAKLGSMGREPSNRLHRSLVCGVDDSDYGRAAARIAGRLAAQLRLKLLIVHVSEAPVLVGNRNEAAATEQLGDRKAQYLLAAVTAEEDLGPVERRVEFGAPAERLAAVAEKEDAELIVVGSRGRGALSVALLGSVSTELIGIAPCPVLVVPPGAAARA